MQTPERRQPKGRNGVAKGVRRTAERHGRLIEVEHPGCYPLIEHPRHTVGVLELELAGGVACHAVCFTAGVI